MTPVSATAEQPEAPLFSDGLGDRVVAVDAATGDLLQILKVRPQLLAVPSFEFALRERAARLANFRHAYYARVRRIDRHPTGLAIVSDHVEGVRLSEMLRVAHARGLQLDLNAALCLLRQLVPSIALLHENARDVAHGLLAPDRIIITPRARLVVVEHVLGSAVEQLQFTRERLWQELRVAVPMSAGVSRFDHRADVTAMGLIALALVLGRPLGDQDYPQRASQLLHDARARVSGLPDQPLPESLHNWIARTLQLDPRQGFSSATDAQAALEDALSDDSEFVAAPVALEAFLSRYIAVMLDPTPVTPPAAPSVSRPAVEPTPAVNRSVIDPPSVSRPVVEPAQSVNRVPEISFAPVAPPSVASQPVVTPPASVIRPPVQPSASRPVVEPPPIPVSSTRIPDVSFAPVTPGASIPLAPIAPASPAVPTSGSSYEPPVVNAPKPSFEPIAPSVPRSSYEPVITPKPAVEPAVSSPKASFEPFVMDEPKATLETPASVSAPAVEPNVSIDDPFVWNRPTANDGQAAASSSSFKANDKPEPRDITELLRGFDLPPAASAPESKAEPIEFEPEPVPARGRFAGWRRIAVAALAIVALAEGVVIAGRAYKKPAGPTLGSLSVQTNPPGVAVFIDGEAKGNTPVRISLKPGAHSIELRGRGVPRVIPVTVTAGAEVSQILEMPETPSAGSLLVQSDPPGAKVTVDGTEYGNAPASVANLAPGEHEVVLQAEGGTPVKQRVIIQAGVTSSVLAPVSTAAAGPVSGWLAVKAPVTIEIRENGRQIGTSDTDKIMMAAGKHDIELVSDTLGYKSARSIQVVPGKVAPITVEFPQGVININASPWAEVWIDGRRAGETPIGNFPISIGPHEVVFRHPQLGEKRQAVSVTLSGPVRLSVDMK